MTELDKIKTLVLHLTEGLSRFELGEMLLTHHVITQATKILIENNDTEALGILKGFQQHVFDEIAARIYRKEINIADAADFHDKMMEKYHQLKNTQNFKDIEGSLSRISGREIDFKTDIERMAKDFTSEYNQIFGVKPRRRKKIPSPDEIINGKQVPGLPNN